MITTDRSGRALWLAAGACAVTGALLLGPTLLPGADPDPDPGRDRRAQPAATELVLESDPTRSPDLVAPSSTAPSSTTPVPEHPPEHEDEAPTGPQAPPLPADQVQGHSDEHAPAADEQQWQPVLTGFAQDFTNPGTGPADWAGRLARWTTPDLAAAYQGVEAAEIPIGALLELTPSDVGTFNLSFTARYDTGLVLRGQAAQGPTSWQITAVEPVDGP